MQCGSTVVTAAGAPARRRLGRLETGEKRSKIARNCFLILRLMPALKVRSPGAVVARDLGRPVRGAIRE